MATTPRDIITAAYGLSSKNQPGKLANEASELLNFVTTVLRGVYAAAARVNPLFFAETADVTLASGKWVRPVEAESIIRVEVGPLGVTASPSAAVGSEIIVVPFDDRDAEKGKPCIYEFAQNFYPARANSPTAGQLRFMYSARAPIPATLDTALDSRWPEQFNRLLICEVGSYLSSKDGRQDEMEVLEKEIAAWQAMFVAFLEHATACEVRRFGRMQRFNVKSLFPGTQ